MHIPLDPTVTQLAELPYTISYVIRKRQQIDSLNELPSEKRPPEEIIWDGTPEELDEWLDRVYDRKKDNVTELKIMEIEE